MTTPGTIVNVSSTSTPNSTSGSTGTFFAIGQTERGAVGQAIALRSMATFEALLGSRAFNGVTQTLFDALTVFFQEGGSLAYVSRVTGAAAETASLILKDQSATPGHTTLKVEALGPGTWGNGITVQVSDGTAANTFVLTIRNGSGSVPEISPDLQTPTQAVSWAATSSSLVRIVNLGSPTASPANNPAVKVATALAGGTDTTDPGDTIWVTALAAFSVDLGPGQVAAPGRTTKTVWEGLVNHAKAKNRLALLDAVNTATAGVIEGDAETVQGNVTDPSYGFMLAPWPVYAGPATNTATLPYPRTVAPSGLVAALMARNDASNNCDVAAAGPNGIARNAIGVSQTYTSTERGALNTVGVGVIRTRNNQVQLYGYTSMSLSPTWADLGNVRLRMQITAGLRAIGDQYEFADIDAAGHTAAAMGGQMVSFMDTLYKQGALYGVTASTAFTVNVGTAVNTPQTAQARQLLASVSCRMSPTGQNVVINVTRVPVTQSLPA